MNYRTTKSPEYLQRALLIGEEEAQQSLPLHKDDDGDRQQAGQRDQYRHGDDCTIG